jgi:hypothetical protein
LPHGASHHGLGLAPYSPHQTGAGAAPAGPPAHLLDDPAGIGLDDHAQGHTPDVLPGSSNQAAD